MQLDARGGIVIAVAANRQAAHALDQVERIAAFQGAQGVAENPAEQPDVLAQGQILFRRDHGHCSRNR